MLLTVLGWAAATILSADGAWNFFRGTLHLNLQLCIAAFALFEISVLACAVTARHRRLASLRRYRNTHPGMPVDPAERHSGGVAGVAVWVFAALSGLFSASHEVVMWGQGVRFVAPLMAAFLFELLVSTEVMDAQGRRRRVNIRFTPERILVALGLADPTDRTAGDVARDKEIARLATLRVRAQEAEPGDKGNRARKAYRRQLERCNERYSLATDARLMAQLQRSLALLYGALDSTTADAVAAANPWSRDTRQRAAAPSQPGPAQARGGGQPKRGPVDDEPKPTRSAEESWALIQQHLTTNPQASKAELARVVNLSRTRVGQILDQFQGPTGEVRD
jgi:hypothetical protein